MHPDAFEALLHYLYTVSLPATVTNAREEAAVIAQDLIVAADRYNLKDLKPVTENKLCKHSFSASTVLPMLVVAESSTSAGSSRTSAWSSSLLGGTRERSWRRMTSSIWRGVAPLLSRKCSPRF